MKDNRPDEMISRLMDGELDGPERERLIQELKTDTQSRHRLERYQLISDTIKQHLPDIYRHDLSQRVSRAVAAEESYQMVPRKEPSQITWRVTGFALAASLAAVAVIGVQWSQPEQSLLGPQHQASAPADMLPPGQAVSQRVAAGRMNDIRLVAEGETVAPAGRSAPVAGAGQVGADPVAGRARLTEYLINHNEYASAISVREGLMPHVRVVGYDSGE